MHANSNIFRTVLAVLAALVMAGVATVSAPSSGLGESVDMAGDDVGLGVQNSTPEPLDSVSGTELVVPTVAGAADDPVVRDLITRPVARLVQDSDSPAQGAGTQATDPVENTSQPASGASESPGDDSPQVTASSSNGSAANPAADGTTSDSPSADAATGDDDQASRASSRVTRTETDAGCSSDHCPAGIGLEPTEINNNDASFAFFPIAGAEPTFTLQRAFPAATDDGSLPTLEIGESTVRVLGMTEGTEYVLTGDRFFGFDLGSTAEVIYFQTLSRSVDRYCDQVEVEFEQDLIMQRQADLYSSTTQIALDPDCQGYDLWLHSADYNHQEGFQTYQVGEQWQLEGMDGAGEILYRSPSSPDLAEDATVAYNMVDEMNDTRVTQVRAFHTGEGNINSVRAGATFMPVIANPRTPSLCGTLDVLFINPTLVNGIDDADRTTVGTPNPVRAREYQIWLYSKDDGHAAGESGGPAEQWFVEGLDEEGNVVYTSPVAPDLADDKVIGQFFAGTVKLDGISTFRGRHLGRLGENSVEASIMLVPVTVELPDEPYPLWCKHLNLQRP